MLLGRLGLKMLVHRSGFHAHIKYRQSLPYEFKTVIKYKQFIIFNKAIIDYTSPALCTPVTPIQADPISSECGSDGMIPVLHYIIGDRVILFAASMLQWIVNGEESSFPAIGGVAYRKHARGGPSHAHRQHG